MKLGDFTRYLLRHSFVRFALVGTAGYVVDAGVLAFDTGILHLDFETGRAHQGEADKGMAQQITRDGPILTENHWPAPGETRFWGPGIAR